jgi:hypothetical protein
MAPALDTASIGDEEDRGGSDEVRTVLLWMTGSEGFSPLLLLLLWI